MPAQRRRLTDLYVVGKPFTANDGEGEIEVWLQKINPLQRQNAIRGAGAVRARTLAFFDDKNSEDYLAMVSEVIDYYPDRAALTTVAIGSDLVTARSRIEAEIAAEPRWSKDDMLSGLVDDWIDNGMSERYAENPKDKEAKRVFDKLQAYDDEVAKQMAAEKISLERDMADNTIEKLRDIAVERLLEAQANNAFINEFQAQRILYGVRDPDNHDELYFKDILEIHKLEDKVRELLITAYDQLEVDSIEGKDLPETDGSSPSSEESGTEDQAPDSGLKVV